MQFITRVNLSTRRALGPVGRPVLEAAAGAGATFGIGVLTGSELLVHPAMVAGVAVGTVIVVEGTMYLLGSDESVKAEYAASDWARLKNRYIDGKSDQRNAIYDGLKTARDHDWASGICRAWDEEGSRRKAEAAAKKEAKAAA